MPKHLSILSAVLLLSPLTAFADPMTIQGQSVDVQVESYRAAPRGMTPHAVQLKSPTTFQFQNGLKLELHGRILLHDNLNIWMGQGTVSKAPVPMEVSGQSVSLNCSERPVVNGVTPTTRIIQFHPNGAYRLGCEVFGSAKVTSETVTAEIAATSSFDMTADGDLSYASKIVAGELNYRGQKVTLKPGTELSLHDRTRPAFFTLSEGTSLRVVLPSGEEVAVSGGAMNASITLDGQGRLEKGVLAEDYVVPRLGYRLTKGSGVIYAENSMDKMSPPYLSTIMLSEPISMGVAGTAVRVNVIELNMFEMVKSLMVTEAFGFRPPEDPTKVITIPAGSKITMANSRRVLKIEVPRPRQ